MQYAILSAANAQDLAEQINQRLSRGWLLYGNLFVEKGIYYQALTYMGQA
jgi:hypothetical protein